MPRAATMTAMSHFLALLRQPAIVLLAGIGGLGVAAWSPVHARGAGDGARTAERAMRHDRSIPAASPDTQPFEHARHTSIACTTCHTRGGRRGLRESSVAFNCQGCHHGDTPVARECVRCHTARRSDPRGRLPPRWSPASGGAADAHAGIRTRSSCQSGAPRATRRPRRARWRRPASCHADHHTAARDCTSCHASAREKHTRELHRTGCATSGCHVREQTAAVTPVRATCLVCHAEQKDHKADRECAPCHLSSWPVPTARGQP
jgi:hypothetical protein